MKALVLALAAAAVLALPGVAVAADYEGAGVDDPAIAVTFKVAGKNQQIVRNFAVSGATYTCDDGQTYNSGFSLNEMLLNDEGRFKFSGTQEFPDNFGTLRIRGTLKMRGKRAVGSIRETIVTKESNVTCTTGKQRWAAERG